MNTKYVSLFLLVLLIASTGFVGRDVSSSVETTLFSSCPNTPRVFMSSDNQNYIHANASVLGAVDGYEWTVSSNAFIISGQGTNQISIGPNCPSGVIEACVRAYINQPGGGICYSAERCSSINYTGPCFAF